MRISVNKDRIYVVLTPMVTSKEMTLDNGKVVTIAIPEQHHERSRIGIVKQVGEEVTQYVPGDKVLLSVYAGVRIHLIDKEIDGEPIDEDRHRVIRQEEIVAKILDD
jgi:co-chaperonin GroES (HSP10)